MGQPWKAQSVHLHGKNHHGLEVPSDASLQSCTRGTPSIRKIGSIRSEAVALVGPASLCPVCHKPNEEVPPVFLSLLEPQAHAVDVLLQPWPNWNLFAFSRKVIGKFKGTRTACILWPQRELFLDLLKLVVEELRLLSLRREHHNLRTGLCTKTSPCSTVLPDLGSFHPNSHKSIYAARGPSNNSLYQ